MEDCTFWGLIMALLPMVMSLNTPASLSTDGTELTDLHSNWIKKLRRELFINRNYDKHTRPMLHHTDKTYIDLQFSLTGITIDEKMGTLQSNGWLGLRWIDQMLKWKPTDFEDLQSLKLTSDQIWKPDMVVYNSVNGYHTMPDSHATLLNDGVVYFVPPLFLNTICSLDYTYYPFDTQTCEIKFGLWTYDSTEVYLAIPDNQTEPDTKPYSRLGSCWVIKEAFANITSKALDCCSPPYQEVIFTFNLKRDSKLDAIIAILPAATLWLLVLVALCMRPQLFSASIHIGCMAIVLLTGLLVYFRITLPRCNKETPIIAFSYSTLLILSALNCAVKLFASHIHHRRYPVPKWLMNCMNCKIIRWVLSGTEEEKVIKDYGATTSETVSEYAIVRPGLFKIPLTACQCCDVQLRSINRQSDMRSTEWYSIASIISRFGLLAYVAISIVIGIQCFLIY